MKQRSGAEKLGSTQIGNAGLVVCKRAFGICKINGLKDQDATIFGVCQDAYNKDRHPQEMKNCYPQSQIAVVLRLKKEESP